MNKQEEDRRGRVRHVREVKEVHPHPSVDVGQDVVGDCIQIKLCANRLVRQNINVSFRYFSAPPTSQEQTALAPLFFFTANKLVEGAEIIACTRFLYLDHLLPRPSASKDTSSCYQSEET